MRAELADGRVLEFPDGTDPAVVQATVKKVIGAPKPAAPAPAKKGPDLEAMAENPVGAVGRAVAQNTFAKVLSGYAGLAGAALPGPEGQGAEFQRATEQALSFEPRSRASRAILTAAGLPYEYLVEKPSHYVGNKIAEKGYPAAGAIVEGAGQAAPVAFGLKSFKYAPSETTTLARKYGMALTPTEGGGGVVSKVAEGLAGEEKLSKAVARKNAERGAQAIGADIGLPKDVPLTRDSIATARRAAHVAYEQARGLGNIVVGEKYGQALDAIEAPYKNAAKSFPDAKPGVAQQVMELVKGLRVPEFDASAAIDQINALREAGNDAYRAGNGAMGKVYKSSAKALEDAMFDGIPDVRGPNTLKQRLQQARERIAKTYEADKALDKDGAINPQKLAKMGRDGKPLSGASKDIATLAQDAPRSFRRDTGGNVSFPTWADAIMAGLTGGVEGAAHGAYSGGMAVPLALVARPATRAILSSDPYQAFQASPIPSAIGYGSPWASAISRIAAEEAKKQEQR
jgi:hypothetical protein